jgi:hypothetical protein
VILCSRSLPDTLHNRSLCGIIADKKAFRRT